MNKKASYCDYLVPVLDVEAKVDVEVLVVVVVEDAVRLPRLPPVRLEVDARVVDDPVVVDVGQQHAYGDCNVHQTTPLLPLHSQINLT